MKLIKNNIRRLLAFALVITLGFTNFSLQPNNVLAYNGENNQNTSETADTNEDNTDKIEEKSEEIQDDLHEDGEDGNRPGEEEAPSQNMETPSAEFANTEETPPAEFANTEETPSVEFANTEETPALILGDTDWSSVTTKFNFNVSLAVPAGKTGDKVVIHLPQYISIAANIDTDETLLGVEITGDSANENGSDIILTFKDTTDSNEVMGKEIYLDQSEFMNTMFEGGYEITVNYTNKNGDELSQSKTYNPTLEADKLSSSSIDVKGLYIQNDQILSSLDYTYEANLAFNYELNDQNTKGFLVIYPSVFDSFQWDGNKDYVQTDGSVKIPIDSTMYKVGENTMNISLPISVREDKKISAYFCYEETSVQPVFAIELGVEFDNGKTYSVPTKNIYPLQFKATSKEPFPISFDILDFMNGKLKENVFFHTLGRYDLKDRFDENRNLDSDQVKALEVSLKGKVKMQITFPENLTWSGAFGKFESKTRTLTLDFDDGILGSRFTSGGVPFYAFHAEQLTFENNYDFDSNQNETPTKLLFSDCKIAYYDETNRDYKTLKRVENVEINVVNYYVVGGATRGELIEGSKNVELGSLAIHTRGKSFAKYNYKFDFNAKDQTGRVSVNDFFDAKRFVITAPKDIYNNYSPIIIKITTEKNGELKEKTTEISGADVEVTVSDDESIQSIEIEPKNNKNNGISDSSLSKGIIRIFGDANVKDREKFFEFGSTVIPYFNPTQKWLSEKDGTEFGIEKISAVWFYPKVIKREPVSLNSTVYYYDAIYPYTKGAFYFYEFPFPNAQYGIDEVTYHLDERFIKEDYLRLNSIGVPKNNPPSIYKKVVYTTNKTPNEITKENIGYIELGEGEYFTSLAITIDNNNAKMVFNYCHSNRLLDKNYVSYQPFFKVDKTDSLAESYIEIYLSKGVQKQLPIKYDAKLRYDPLMNDFGTLDATSGTSVTLGFGLDIERTLPIIKNQYVNEDLIVRDFDVIYNPTFYLPIPNEFDYEELLLSGSMRGKKPYIGYVNDNGNKLLKVEFYGDENSATGYHDRFEDGDMKLKLKVSPYAKSGLSDMERTMYVDLSSHISRYSQDKLLKFEEKTPSDFIDLYDTDSQKTVRVRKSHDGNVMKYNIVQTVNFIAGASVNLVDSFSETNSLSVRSGEEFNVNINLYNGIGNVTDFAMYIPVAKEGKNGWDWSANLLEAGLDTTGNITVSYSTKENPSTEGLKGNPDPSGEYVSNVSDLSKVTMVKLSAGSINRSTKISLKARVANLLDKTEYGNQTITVKGEYFYRLNGTGMNTTTNDVSVTLTDTTIQGTLFVDTNENGVLDSDDKKLANKKVLLFDQSGRKIDEAISDTNGIYQFTVPALRNGDYVKVEEMEGHVLTWQQKGNNRLDVSYFDRETYQAIPNLKNAEYLNAGYVEAPEIVLEPDTYTIRMKKTDRIGYKIKDNSTKDVKFLSQNEAIVTVDETGVMTPVKPGKTKVEVYYETVSGIRISAFADVTVETNEAPIIQVPKELTMNVGDLWDPLDTSIVEGLAVSDDHDNVTVNDLKVEASIPVGDKFLFFFRTNNTDRLLTAGTYLVKYSYEDEDGNKAAEEMVLKVNSQPYLKDLNGNLLTQDNMPYYYFRVGNSLNPMKDVKAFYDRAVDQVGDKPETVEISSTSTENGIFTIENPRDKDGKPVIGSPDKAGMYYGTYYIKTASAAKSEAVLELDRTLYAQGKINIFAHNIAYSGTDPVKSYQTWEEFYDKFKKELALKASLETPLQDGTTEEIDLLKDIEVVDSTTKQPLDFSTLDFSLPSGEAYKTITLTLRVKDAGTAGWEKDGQSVYGEAIAYHDIDVTIQEVVDGVPHIHFKDIERIASDEIRDITISNDDLSSDDRMQAAVAAGKHPLLDRLMNDVTFEDDKTPSEQIKKSITKIERISQKSDASKKDSYDPQNEYEIRDMMTTVGTYEVTYQAIDGDHNVIFAERTIYVAGDTIFVSRIGTGAEADVPVKTAVKVLESNTPYIPAGVFAYHIDYDEVTKHETTAIAEVRSLDISKPGTYEVVYKTKHHFDNFPGSTEVRPLPSFTQKIEVNGKVVFNQADNQIKSYFVDDQVDLNEVKASFKKAQTTSGEAPVDTDISVINDQGGNVLTSNEPASISVKYTADASLESGIINHKATLNQVYNFYGHPQIVVDGIIFTNDEVNLDISENMNQSDFEKRYPIRAEITLPDGTKADLTDKIAADFTHMNDESNPSITLSVTYTLENSNSKTDTKTIHLRKVKAPVITTNQDVYSYNVGDTFDLLLDTGLNVAYESEVKPSDIDISYGEIMGALSFDTDGKLNAPGTYKVIFSYTDAVENRAVKEILVKVNGLPVIEGIEDMEKRVGDDFSVWNKIKVNWQKATDTEGRASDSTYTYETASAQGAELTLREMKDAISGKDVDYSSLNTPGYYSGVYYTKTPEGGEAAVKHTLLLHGRPVLTANDLMISKNDTDPGDILKAYEKRLSIKASVERAHTDRAAEVVDLSDKVKINEEKSDDIKFGTVGNYKVVLEVSDPVSVKDSKHDTVSYEITLSIVDTLEPDKLPVIATPDRNRVVGDPIGKDDSGKANIEQYLVDQPKITIVDDNLIVYKALKSIKKLSIKEEKTDKNIKLDNASLKAMLNTVGIYEAEIELTDSLNNKMTVKQKWYIAGPTEFGIGDSDTDFKQLSNHEVLNIRQSDTPYNLAIRARHQDPDGSYHYMMTSSGTNLDVKDVKKLDQVISSAHHYTVYENDESMPRKHDEISCTLLVHGKIKISGDDDIYTRVGSDVDVLSGMSATYTRIDQDGKTYEESAELSAGTYENGKVGKNLVKITARDQLTQAMPNEVSVTRSVYVLSVPNVSYNEVFNVSVGASEQDIHKALALSAAYQDYNGKTMTVNEDDIHVDISKVDTTKPGHSYDIRIAVDYRDNGSIKTVEKTARVYVMNDPVAIVEIPSRIELKDEGDKAKATPMVRLYPGSDKDDNKSNIPTVDIKVDSVFKLHYGDSSVNVQTYKEDGSIYDGITPIMSLRYGGKESGIFHLAVNRNEISKKGTYEGVLNFFIGYEGGQDGNK